MNELPRAWVHGCACNMCRSGALAATATLAHMHQPLKGTPLLPSLLSLQPPYWNKGARPAITSAPGSTFTGQQITVTYSHSNAGSDPVERAILIRTGSVTHSQAFGEF